MCSKGYKTDVLEIYSNGYKTDILNNSVSLAILFCMLVISLQLIPIIFFYCKYTVKYIKRYEHYRRAIVAAYPDLLALDENSKFCACTLSSVSTRALRVCVCVCTVCSVCSVCVCNVCNVCVCVCNVCV